MSKSGTVYAVLFFGLQGKVKFVILRADRFWFADTVISNLCEI